MEINKDTKLTADQGWHGIRLFAEESAALQEWIAQHRVTGCKMWDIQVSQTGMSGIGTNTVVRCNSCGEGKDITEYGAW